MKILELIQGTPEWHAHRATHFNASDAPAMMGVSPYKSRTQLLKEKHTGLAAEVDAATQHRFDDGHRFEALARPLAEEIIGDDLYPVTGSEGELSASFDGLTMSEEIAFEHKSLNDELRSAMFEGCTGADLPLAYRVQMEQQCMVAGCKRVLFMASKWNGDELIEERHCWYESSQHLADDIFAGWHQFAADLAAYQPAPVASEVVGRTPETLPALRIEVTGMVTDSNLEQYREHALAVFAGINRDLKTDQDFANAAKTVQWCGEVETRLKAAKEHALSQTESIDKLFKTIDAITEEAKATRLELNRLVEARKVARKSEIVAGGAKALADHVAALNARLGKPYMPTTVADFGGAVKGLRTFESMQNAVDTTLANAKITANATADGIDVNLKHLAAEATDLMALFPDVAGIVLKKPDDFVALVQFRLTDHRAKEQKRIDAERERIRQEELQRIEREQAAAARRVEAEKAAAPAPVAVAAPTPAPAVVQMPTRAAPAPTSAPTLTLGQIGTRLGFSLTADFLKTLGFEPAGRQRAAVLFHESQFPHICAALVDHIQSIQALQAA